MAEKPEYYNKKVSFFAAIGPAVLFDHSTEPLFRDLSGKKWYMDLLIGMNYLEFDGKDRLIDNDLMFYVKL